MEYEYIKAYIADSMKTVFAFCLTRLRHREEAEDLASEIICRVLDAAPRIRADEKDIFLGYLWRIARNTYVDYLRKKKIVPLSLNHTFSNAETGEGALDLADDTAWSVEEQVIDEIMYEQRIQLLRRELSLLSSQYRQATVLYYMEHNSCTEIAKKLGTSTDMVKYYLFRSRKLILEGMNMNRIYGEKSYRPKTMEIDFWGTHGGVNAEYTAFKERKLKGNILAAAYYSPMTENELSMELGVALPYLEDELALLVERRYLTTKNGKYVTNIPLFTEECTAEIDRTLTALTNETVGRLSEKLQGKPVYTKEPLPDENSLRWQLITLCCSNSLTGDNCYKDIVGTYDPDSPYALLGDRAAGIIWGRFVDTDIIQSRMHGISNNSPSSDGRAALTTINFWQVASLQTAAHANEAIVVSDDALCAAAADCFDALPEQCRHNLIQTDYVVDGKPNFPVYTQKGFADTTAALKDVFPMFDDYIRRVRETAASVTADHAPDHIRETARKVGAFIYTLRGYEVLVDALHACGWLKIPEGTFKPAMFVILRETV
ncbi:MAG: sigma-70 family RNA polymerase sigma factor [Clostridia bacterium]|nr:sigma-70 family RNA polymerase sigma factor [Clostridia bacterium]